LTLPGENPRPPEPAGRSRPRGFRRLFRAAGDSARGFVHALRNEEAFRIEFVLAMLLIPLGLWLGETGVERALLVGTVLAVLIVELINTAIEVTVDRIGTEDNELSGRAKDLASAAVFICMIVVVTVWAAVLI
jgi:diacylglycerol kinase (ATP)